MMLFHISKLSRIEVAIFLAMCNNSLLDMLFAVEERVQSVSPLHKVRSPKSV
jgi:hypothetical protein